MEHDKIIICAVTNDLSQDQRMHKICETLSKKYTVRLVGRHRKNSLDLDAFPFQTKRLHCWFETSFLFYLEYNIRLFIYLLDQKFTCINANDLDTVMACRMAAILKGKHFVFDAHEIFTEVPELSKAPLKKWIWKTIGSIFLSKSQYNYTVNNSLSNHLSEKYSVPFEVIQNYPLYKNQSTVFTAQTPMKFIYQGVMNQGRGVEQIIEAVKEIQDAQLILAGTGDLESKIMELIHGFENRITYVGFLPPGELKKLTSTCHVGFNILTKESLNYYYSSANKYFDYIMAEIPCISMDFPEYHRANGSFQTAILIPSYEVKNIIMAMNQMMHDPDLYQTFQSNCSKAKQIFNWESQTEKLLEIYKELLSKT